MKRILFLYASKNSGHAHAANAVKNVIECFDSKIETLSFDIISHLYPIIGNVIAKTYLELLKYTPQIWNFVYDNYAIHEATKEIRQFLAIINAPKFNNFIERYNPQAIVCTHAIPFNLLLQQKKDGKLNSCLIGIITDFAAHSYWISKDADLYIVANEQTKRSLIKRGIKPNRISPCGIPIDVKFSRIVEKSEAKSELGLNPKLPAVLIMGGSYGLGPIENILTVLKTNGNPNIHYHLIVVTGTNEKLFKSIKKSHEHFPSMLLSHTKNVHKLMDASDIIITKPGGLTSSEALAKGVPMIIINPLPGQEERNARYLVSSGSAVSTNNIKELTHILKKLLLHPRQLNKMKQNCQKISKPYSAYNTAREIMQFAYG